MAIAVYQSSRRCTQPGRNLKNGRTRVLGSHEKTLLRQSEATTYTSVENGAQIDRRKTVPTERGYSGFSTRKKLDTKKPASDAKEAQENPKEAKDKE